MKPIIIGRSCWRWCAVLLVMACFLAAAQLAQLLSSALQPQPRPRHPPTSFLGLIHLAADVQAREGNSEEDYTNLSSHNLENNTQLIDLNDFRYIINNRNACPQPPETLLLLVLVHSAVGNREKRDAIRSTWGRVAEVAGTAGALRVLFLLGALPEFGAVLQERLKTENVVHGDLVQGSFLDHYHNLTYKHMMALKWAMTFCPAARYVAKLDDDGYVNMPMLLGTLRDLSPEGARNLLLCPVRHGVRVKRAASKWVVTKEELARDLYPTMCLGVAIIYSPDVVQRLYAESGRARFLWIDDAFVTGILAERTNTSHSALGALLLLHPKEFPDQMRTPVLFSYELETDRMEEMWVHFHGALERKPGNAGTT